jgi:XTP/dITP diphosphohydrolase
MRLVCASANPDKVAEIAEILDGTVELLPRPPDVPDVVEDADTLEGNARLKAQALVTATGEAAVADDTGLFVDALGGAPGLHTARFAGVGATYEDNVARLLDDLAPLRLPRTARFVTVALVRWPDGRELVAEGAVEGVIAATPRGGRGFGYDPVFAPVEGDGRTFAEMSRAEKHRLSHRARAFRGLLAVLGTGG